MGFTSRGYAKLSDVVGDLLDASALVVATATYEAGVFPYMRFVVELIVEKIKAVKSVLILSNYGWGPVAGNKLKAFFEQAWYRVIDVVEFRAGEIERYREKITRSVAKLVEVVRSSS